MAFLVIAGGAGDDRQFHITAQLFQLANPTASGDPESCRLCRQLRYSFR